jgi:type II secretory pathway component PulF
MPVYIYKAKQGPEKTVEGELQADTEPAALRRIEEMGLSPVWVREAPLRQQRARRTVFLRRISNRDVTVFTSQLASLTRSAVPILRSLRTIAGHSSFSSRMIDDTERAA